MEPDNSKPDVGMVLVPENEYMNRLLALLGGINDSVREMSRSLNILTSTIDLPKHEKYGAVNVRVVED